MSSAGLIRVILASLPLVDRFDIQPYILADLKLSGQALGHTAAKA